MKTMKTAKTALTTSYTLSEKEVRKMLNGIGICVPKNGRVSMLTMESYHMGTRTLEITVRNEI